MKLRAWVAILMAGVVGIVVGCSGGAKGDRPSQSAAQTSSAQTSSAQSNAAAPAATSAATASGEIGVPECDDYMTKYRQCIESKVPEAMKATMRQSFDQATAAWKQAAATPEARASLASACQQATDAAKAAMQAYGCAF